MTGKYKNRNRPERVLRCPECGAAMTLQKSDLYTYRSGKPRKYYRCVRYPECKASHSAHPDGSPQGVPVPEMIRRFRKYVHVIATSIWDYDDEKERAAMYEWLAKNTKSGHIGKMLEPELVDLEEKLLKLTAHLNQE